MLIDEQTLRDLDIIKTGEVGKALFDFIDKTNTTGGKHRLKEKLLHPPVSLGLVRMQQDAIRYLAGHLVSFSLPFNDRHMKALEDYLSTNIIVLRSNNVVESLRFCLVDIQAYRYLKNSVSEMISFIKAFYRLFHDHKEKEGLPAILQKAYQELHFLIHGDRFKEICAQPVNTVFTYHHVLQADRLIRTQLKKYVTGILSWYYETDALLAMAKTTNECHFSFPDFIDTKEGIFEAERLYHPMLPKAVPVDIKLNRDSQFIFLTGPNMSGKTTFLKATGIAVYFAHLGMGVPAKRVTISYFDRIFTSLNKTDNILNGYSFFLSEVKRVKQLAEAINSGENVFSLFDELFRGTNVKDAYDATVMVASGLALWRNSMFVLSSHLWEVWDSISHWGNIRALCFESNIENGVPLFTYRLVSGVSQMRLGLTIIENEKIMELLKCN